MLFFVYRVTCVTYKVVAVVRSLLRGGVEATNCRPPIVVVDEIIITVELGCAEHEGVT